MDYKAGVEGVNSHSQVSVLGMGQGDMTKVDLFRGLEAEQG